MLVYQRGSSNTKESTYVWFPEITIKNNYQISVNADKAFYVQEKYSPKFKNLKKVKSYIFI